MAMQSPNPSTYVVHTDSTTPSILRLRLTDVPGWRATIDGHGAILKPFSHIMLDVSIPPGRHTVVVTYWPRAFTLGLFLALLSSAGLVAALAVARFRRRPLPKHRPRPKHLASSR